MGHWALDDAFFPIQQVEGLEQKLKQANVKYANFTATAKHAFANGVLTDPSAAIAYNASAARDSIGAGR